MNLNDHGYGFFNQTEQWRRLTQPSDAIRQLTREYENLRQLALPRREVQEAISRQCQAAQAMVDSIALQLDRDRRAFSLPIEQLSAAEETIKDQMRRLDIGIETERNWQLLRGPEQLIDGVAVACSVSLQGYLEQLRKAQTTLQARFGNDLRGAIDWDFDLAIAPALAAYQRGLIGPSLGLLAGSSSASMLTWTNFSGLSSLAPTLMTAPVLSGPSAKQPRFRVCASVVCRFCAEPMLVRGEDRYVDSDGILNVDLMVVPLCSTRLRRANDDPDYWSTNLEPQNPRKPALRLVQGAGEETSEPRGRELLRLVSTDADPGDELP